MLPSDRAGLSLSLPSFLLLLSLLLLLFIAMDSELEGRELGRSEGLKAHEGGLKKGKFCPSTSDFPILTEFWLRSGGLPGPSSPEP